MVVVWEVSLVLCGTCPSSGLNTLIGLDNLTNPKKLSRSRPNRYLEGRLWGKHKGCRPFIEALKRNPWTTCEPFLYCQENYLKVTMKPLQIDLNMKISLLFKISVSKRNYALIRSNNNTDISIPNRRPRLARKIVKS